MRIKYFTFHLLFASIFLFYSCCINDSIEQEYSHSVSENGLTLLIKNGSLSSPGEIKIINNSNQKIFIPFILYPYCSFLNYALDKKNDSVWERLSYDESQDLWFVKNNQDSISAVCQMYKNPVELNPFQTIKQKISNVEEEGEFQLKVYFRYIEVFNPDFPNKEIIINYTVN